jgi:hypothetical protein
MKNKKTNTLIFVFVIILILLLIGAYYQKSQVESFDININDTIAAAPSDFNQDINMNIESSDLVGLSYDPTMYLDPTLNSTTDIKSRDCAVYYVNDPNPNTDATLRSLCDSGFFDKPAVTMKVRQNMLETKRQNGSINANEITELKYISWYNSLKPQLPNGTCKVNFPGWVEPNKTADNQTYPIKNAVNFADKSRGNPQDWAFCYQQVNSAGGESVDAAAFRTSKKLADEKAIISTNGAVQPFNDNNSFARVAFKTLVLDDFIRDAQKIKNQPDGSDLNNIVCAAGNLPPVTGMPSDGSFLILQLDANNKVKYFNPALYNSTTQRIQIITSSETLFSIYKQFFTIQLRGNAVYIVPNRFNGTIYTLMTDICKNPSNKNTSLEMSGRIVNVTSTSQFIFSLVANLGLNAQVLYQSLGPDDITYGDLPKLQDTLTKLQVQQAQLQQQIDTFVLPPNIPNKTGLQRKNYKINSFAWGMNTPDMDDVFANSSRTTYTTTDVVAQPKFYSEQWASIVYHGGWYLQYYRYNNFKNGYWQWVWRYWGYTWEWHDIRFGQVYEGYIQAPETGEYTIMINSDDGGDVMINNQMIASYYGGHWVSYGGKNGKITMQAGQYYPIRIRMLQWEGAVGLQLFWLRPSRANMGSSQCTAPQPLRDYLPKMPQINACFEEIPASAYFYYNDPDVIQKRAQYQSLLTNRDSFTQQQQQVQRTIDTINTTFKNQVTTLSQSIIGLNFTGIDFANVSSDGNFYLYIGSFNTSLSSTSDSINQQVVKLYQPTVNICTKQLEFDSPINQSQIQSGIVQYSVAFWIRIDDINAGWRNILFHGSGDDWSNNVTIDRTPGIWIIPNSTAIHFSQRSKTNVNPWTSLDYAPGVNRWYHFVAVVNNTTTDFYINGSKVRTATLGSGDQYMWNQQNKKLYINNSPPWGGKCTSSVLLNNLIWYNYPLPQNEITPLYAQKPFANTIPELLANASTSGTYTLLQNDNQINLFVYVDSAGKKWILILLYNHRGGTNPALNPIKSGNFPIPLNNTLDNIPVGRDDSGTAAWGHVAPSYLANFSVNEIAFLAKGGSKNATINFRTTDASVIRYATTGQGRMNPGFATSTGSIFTSTQSSSIPNNAPNYFENQGDYALTEFPFWRGGQAHWGIRGLGNRWEIDDFPGNANYNTLHMVFIA